MRTDPKVQQGKPAELNWEKAFEPVEPFLGNARLRDIESRFDADFQRIFVAPKLTTAE